MWTDIGCFADYLLYKVAVTLYMAREGCCRVEARSDDDVATRLKAKRPGSGDDDTWTPDKVNSRLETSACKGPARTGLLRPKDASCLEKGRAVGKISCGLFEHVQLACA